MTHGVGLFLTLLSTTTETEDQVEGGLLLDVVVGESAAILELLAGEDQALLVRGDAAWSCKHRASSKVAGDSPLLVLDLGLDIVDRVRRLHLEGDGLSGQRLDEDLHASTKTKD